MEIFTFIHTLNNLPYDQVDIDVVKVEGKAFQSIGDFF